jgi:hypothetical protein
MNIHIDMFWVFLFGMFVVCVIFFLRTRASSLTLDSVLKHRPTVLYTHNSLFFQLEEGSEGKNHVSLPLFKIRRGHEGSYSINSLQVLFIKQLSH